ncbi:oxamate carbamoyltransferase subunit AllH family protein [Nocardioides palaemonis]|uniref:oxamate carbamoyltransferase subunit AllH family protein n=1 Tax=Nocardioides palaemonis TaxID=2829810 RepID=UPI002010D1B8|nr:DUF2877 domain-containing protein [Nocardioides palaemonis]
MFAGSVSTPLPVAAPARVLVHLGALPDGPLEVVHASASAVYVDVDGWCLGLVAASASRVPCALWSSEPDLTDLSGEVASRRPTTVTARVEGGGLVVAGRRLRIARVVDTRVTVLPPEVPAIEPARQVVTAHGLDLPADGRLTAAHVDALLGRGPGLTPLGDDVLAGWLVVRAAAGRPDVAVTGAVRRRRAVTTLLSGTLLDCALHGEALPQLGAWLAAPGPATLAALLDVGATSGAGLATGAGLALASLREPCPSAA